METRTTAEGIKIPVNIKASRLLIVKRTPGPWGRYYACNSPHYDAYTFVLTIGWANWPAAIEMWQCGEKLGHWRLNDSTDWDNHSVIKEWSDRCFPQRRHFPFAGNLPG